MSELKPRHTPDVSQKELLSLYAMRVRRNELHIGRQRPLSPEEIENASRMDELGEEILAKLAAHEVLVEALEAAQLQILQSKPDEYRDEVLGIIRAALAQAKGGE